VSPYLLKYGPINREAQRFLKDQRRHFISERLKQSESALQENEEQLRKVPDIILPQDIKERFMKVKKGITRRLIMNQA